MPETQVQVYVNESCISYQRLSQREGFGGVLIEMFGVEGRHFPGFFSIPIAIAIAVHDEERTARHRHTGSQLLSFAFPPHRVPQVSVCDLHHVATIP